MEHLLFRSDTRAAALRFARLCSSSHDSSTTIAALDESLLRKVNQTVKRARKVRQPKDLESNERPAVSSTCAFPVPCAPPSGAGACHDHDPPAQAAPNVWQSESSRENKLFFFALSHSQILLVFLCSCIFRDDTRIIRTRSSGS